MPLPSEATKTRIGPLQKPFARLNARDGTDKKPERGESLDFTGTNYDATKDDAPKGFKKVSKVGPWGKPDRYLWIVNEDGLFLQLESTPNLKAKRKCICHTNLTAGKKAYQGGELWFVSRHEVVINYSSGRFGADADSQMDAVVAYFKKVGYTVRETDGARDYLR